MKTRYPPSWILCALLYAHPCPQAIGSSTTPHTIPYQELQEKNPASKEVVDRCFRDKKENLELIVSNILLLSERSKVEHLNTELHRLDEAYFYEIILPAIGQHQDVLTHKGDKMTLKEDKSLVESLFQRRNAKYVPPSKRDTPTGTPLTLMLSKDPKQVAEQEEILRDIRNHCIEICQAINTGSRYQIKSNTAAGNKLWSRAGLLAGGVALGAIFSSKKETKEEDTDDAAQPAAQG